MEFILVENKFWEREKKGLVSSGHNHLVVILLSLEHSWNLINMSANQRISGRDSEELITGLLQAPRSDKTEILLAD